MFNIYNRQWLALSSRGGRKHKNPVSRAYNLVMDVLSNSHCCRADGSHPKWACLIAYLDMLWVMTFVFDYSFLFLLLILTDDIFLTLIFRQSEGWGETEKETSMWEKHIDWVPPTYAWTRPGMEPTTEVHALDRNQSQEPSVRRLTLYSQSQTGFGPTAVLNRP